MSFFVIAILLSVWIYAIFICCPLKVFAFFSRIRTWTSSRVKPMIHNEIDGLTYQWYEMLIPKADNPTIRLWYGIQQQDVEESSSFVVGVAKEDDDGDDRTLSFCIGSGTRTNQEKCLNESIVPFLEQYVDNTQIDIVRAAATEFIEFWYPIPDDMPNIEHSKIYRRRL